MLEQFGDAWELSKGNILCITTNGFVKKNGEAVMGRGIASQAKKLFPKLPAYFGESLLRHGNHVIWLGKWGQWFLVSFPTKHNWWEKSDPELIKISVQELKQLQIYPIHKVYLPRPGCSNGGLNWIDVKPLVENLNDQYIIVDYKKD